MSSNHNEARPSAGLPGLPVRAGRLSFGRCRRLLRLAAVWLLGGSGALAAGAAAAEPIWYEAHYPYTVIEHELQDILRDFGSNVGLPVHVSSQVRGWVRGPMPSGSGKAFLDRLSESHRFDWYFDGKALHISADDEAGERVIDIRGIRPEAIERSLRSLGFADARFPLRVSREQNIAVVAGPPRYVALVESAIRALRPKPARDVEVIRGRNS